jgi:hypothetical protein
MFVAMRNKNELQNQLNAHQSNRSNFAKKNDHKTHLQSLLNSDDIYYAVLVL